MSLSVGTIHTWVAEAAQRAGGLDRAQDLSGVRVDLHDEIFQGNQPVLVGLDAASTPPRPIVICCRTSSSATPTQEVCPCWAPPSRGTIPTTTPWPTRAPGCVRASSLPGATCRATAMYSMSVSGARQPRPCSRT